MVRIVPLAMRIHLPAVSPAEPNRRHYPIDRP